MSWSLSGLSEFNTSDRNKVVSCGWSYDTGIVPVNIPLTSSENTVSFNVLGKKQTFILDGEYHGTSNQIKSFISEMTSWFNRNWLTEGSTPTKTFTDHFGSEFSVKPMKFDYDFVVNQPGMISYQIRLMQSKT